MNNNELKCLKFDRHLWSSYLPVEGDILAESFLEALG